MTPGIGGFDEPPREDTTRTQAEAYRQAQARRMLKCYEASVGRPAATTEELAEWLAEHEDEVPHDKRGKIVPLYGELYGEGER